MLQSGDEHWREALARKAQAYAETAFDLDLHFEPIGPATLPFYLVDCYAFWRAVVFDRPCIFMAPRPADSAEGWAEMPRHRDIVRHQLKVELVLLLFDGLPPRRRKALVSDRIAFMVAGSQLYVPEVMLELREGRPARRPGTQAPDTFAPTTQLLALAALLGRPVGGGNATTLARRFGVAAMSMVRAFDELQAADVADTGRVGRQRTLHLRAEGLDLWCAVLPYLKSPVRKVRRVAIPYPEAFPGLVAGESALSLYTPLAGPRVQTLAVAAAGWNRVVREHIGGVDVSSDHGDAVETWSYDPAALAEDKVVDPLSLYLSVRHHKDERVAQAAEQLLENAPWS